MAHPLLYKCITERKYNMKTKDIRVNKELIMKYDPCISGLDNFNKHYKDISIKKLINSKNISYEHKVWLLRHIVPPDLLVLWAIDSSFAAYEYSHISANAADYAAGAAGAAANAAVYAADAANYANAANYAKNERLQSLLYFIENEE